MKKDFFKNIEFQRNKQSVLEVEHVNPDNVTVFTASTTMETSVTIRDQEDLP